MWRRRELIGTALLAGPLLAGACTADTFVGADGGPPADGGQDGGSDATQAADANGIGDAASQGCTCTAPDICCVYSSSQGTTFSCATTVCPAPQPGQSLSALACTSTADCGGLTPVCCIWRVNSVNQSACLAQCDSTQNQVQLCDPASADAGCPVTAPCSTTNIVDWTLPTSFATCGGQGVP